MDLDVSEVCHVKAHGSEGRIERLEGSELKIAKGNVEVDLLARAGAELGANFGRRQAVVDLACRVR
eukprot:15008-Pyramimonas_sp.AAC.1